MERLLHFLWKYKFVPTEGWTTDGKKVRIVDVGTGNPNQGPDFFNAKLYLDDTLWAGNIEIHVKSSDWFRHRHHTDPRYNNVILHLVETADCTIDTEDGRHPPQMEVRMVEDFAARYEELCRTDEYPRCHKVIPDIDKMNVHAWMDALLIKRLEQKVERIDEMLRQSHGDWEQACFVTLCRNFGFGLNGDAFERWGKKIPLQDIGKHRDHLLQVEAIFLGMAGLIDHMEPTAGKEKTALLHREFDFLSHKFQLPEPMSVRDWRFSRSRPQNFPHNRMMQLAQLFHEGKTGIRNLIEPDKATALIESLRSCSLSDSTIQLIIINTAAPLKWAYGRTIQDQGMMDNAIDLLRQVPAENNRILRLWKQCGLNVDNAADSQALIQLKQHYCDTMDCLRCRFGYEFMKTRK